MGLAAKLLFLSSEEPDHPRLFTSQGLVFKVVHRLLGSRDTPSAGMKFPLSWGTSRFPVKRRPAPKGRACAFQSIWKLLPATEDEKGTKATIRVPRPGLDRISHWPPSNRTRSPSEMRPRP
jgi:hypothetical protein